MQFCLALSVAMFALLFDREGLGLRFLLMFHCLLRQGEARAVEWFEIHIFDDISASRFEGVFGVVSVRLPRTRRPCVHSQLQHVRVECKNIALLLRWRQLRAAQKRFLRSARVFRQRARHWTVAVPAQTWLRPSPRDSRRLSRRQSYRSVAAAAKLASSSSAWKVEYREDLGKVRPSRCLLPPSSLCSRTAPASTLIGNACSVILRRHSRWSLEFCWF